MSDLVRTQIVCFLTRRLIFRVGAQLLSRRFLVGRSITIEEPRIKIDCDGKDLWDRVAIEHEPNIEIILDEACKDPWQIGVIISPSLVTMPENEICIL